MAYIKYSKRAALNFPTLGLASFVKMDGKGECCQEVIFALTGHGSQPTLIEATKLLTGLDEPMLTEDQINHLLQEVRPVTHMGVSSSFKRRIVGVLFKKAFQDSWKMALESKPNPI